MTRWLPVDLTEFQAQVVIDALDLYTEGGRKQALVMGWTRPFRAGVGLGRIDLCPTHSTDPASEGVRS